MLRLLSSLAALVIGGPGCQKAPQTAPAAVWPLVAYRIVPVRVHLLRTEQPSAIGTALKTEDVERIFRKANTIWHVAGVHLWVESIVNEKPNDGQESLAFDSVSDSRLLNVRPEKTRQPGRFHLYYLHQMRANGIYIQADGLFVKETAQLRPVEGGIDEPLPRVTSHELGHAMGLPHRQDTTNLMASGTTGTLLNAAEISRVRETIPNLTWIEPVDLFWKNAQASEKAGMRDEAVSRYRCLLALPGDSPLKARARSRLKALDRLRGSGGSARPKRSDAITIRPPRAT